LNNRPGVTFFPDQHPAQREAVNLKGLVLSLIDARTLGKRVGKT
jgi:hypothetical protein